MVVGVTAVVTEIRPEAEASHPGGDSRSPTSSKFIRKAIQLA